ncbi:hypothetical protein HKX48_000933 [Thoreauomyces humboldtii]|nr:hypothetical protein HKX48_000933 [Thoreauomyces humboldtii]
MSRVVFVGNIPYDLTETQLVDIFKEVGPVVSFRLVFDRETGKPKGYGFCTFQDAETAASAVRNLNNYDVGGRQLRIDFAESDKEDNGPSSMHSGGGAAPRPDDRIPPPVQQQVQPSPPQQQLQQNQQIPKQQPIPMQQQAAQPSSIDAINTILASYPPEQMLEVLAQMKTCVIGQMHVQSDPVQVHAVLSEQPQLSYALFQALLVMNVVEPAVMQRILQNQPQHQHQLQPQQQFHQQHQGFAPPPQGFPHQQAVPPQQQFGQPAAGLGVDQLAPQQQALLVQLLSLTPEQILLLPADQREKIILLKAQMLGQG